MLNIQTINCMQYTEPAVIQTWSQSRNEINTHTEHLAQKKQQFPLIEKKAIWSLPKEKKTRKQERKANRIITLDGKNNKKVEWQQDIGLRNFA